MQVSHTSEQSANGRIHSETEHCDSILLHPKRPPTKSQNRRVLMIVKNDKPSLKSLATILHSPKEADEPPAKPVAMKAKDDHDVVKPLSE